MNRITYTTRAYNATGVQLNSTFAGIRPPEYQKSVLHWEFVIFLRLNDFNNFEWSRLIVFETV